MKKIGVFYGPQGGSTERAAKKIAESLGNKNCDLISVEGKDFQALNDYENIIFGLSTIGSDTWEADVPTNDWDIFFPEIEKADFQNKVIAIFGLGDHITYDLYFCDSMGILGEKLLEKNAEIIGRVDTSDYEFRESKAVIDNKFIGLPIDEDYSPEKTNERIENWTKQLIKKFK